MKVPRGLSERMNRVYYELNEKKNELYVALSDSGFEISTGWYNEHCEKDETGEYQVMYFPIPVIAVKGACDVEISFDLITVTTHMKRDMALDYSFEAVGAEFEAYGVEEYASDYYRPGLTIQDLKNNIARSGETEIGFAFMFPYDTDGEEIADFIKLIRDEGFYY